MKKKVIKIILGIILILAVIGIIYASTTLNKKNNELDSHLVKLTYKELKEKLDNKPKLKDVLSKYDIKAYEIALDKLSDDETKVFNEIANVSGTPTTIFIKNGSESTTSNRLVGDIQDEDTIITRFKALGFIKE